MRVFVDVGAHYGETLHCALDPRWSFDVVHVIEPTNAGVSLLRGFRDPRVKVHPIALADRDGSATIYGAGLLGGSLYADKQQCATDVEPLNEETVTLRRASDWFRENIPLNAEVMLKLNCEGSECDILDDLIQSGEIERVKDVYVDFDVRKIASQAHRQKITEAGLCNAGVSFSSPNESAGNNAMNQWLERTYGTGRASGLQTFKFKMGFYAPVYSQVTGLVGKLLPRRLYWWIGRRFGRLARSNW